MKPRDNDMPALARVRVVAPPQPAPSARTPWRRGPDLTEEGALYVHMLIRAQLRLAVVVAVCFAASLTAASLAIAAIPLFMDVTLFDVPLPWVLQAYGMYPLVIAFAAIYVRGARRNEQRYRSLEANL